MAIGKNKVSREDVIIGRLAQIEQALGDINITAGNLRRERTALWGEYQKLIAEALGVGKKPEEGAAADG